MTLLHIQQVVVEAVGVCLMACAGIGGASLLLSGSEDSRLLTFALLAYWPIGELNLLAMRGEPMRLFVVCCWLVGLSIAYLRVLTSEFRSRI